MNKYFNDIVSHFDKYPTPTELANYIVKHNVSTDTIQMSCIITCDFTSLIKIKIIKPTISFLIISCIRNRISAEI